MGVCGQIHDILGVLAMEKFENHRMKEVFRRQNRGQNIHFHVFFFFSKEKTRIKKKSQVQVKCCPVINGLMEDNSSTQTGLLSGSET